MTMGRLLIGTLLLVLATGTSYGQAPIPFRLTNPLPEARTDEVVTITRKQYLDRTGYLPGWLTPQAYDSTGAPIPTQADDLTGDGLWDEIAILVSLGPSQTARYTLSLLSPDRMPRFPHRTRAWLAPYVMTSDSTGEYREVAWWRINIDTTKSLYAQFQMGGPVFENERQAYIATIHNTGGIDMWEIENDTLAAVGPPHRYKAYQVQNPSRYSITKEPILYKYWFVANGPVRSLGYFHLFNKDRWWILMEVHRRKIDVLWELKKPVIVDDPTTIRITGF